MTYRQDPPGDVRAFDAKTGKQVWSFHTVPEQGEPGVETWQDDSWKITGHTNVWAPMRLDEARGLVYLPVEHAEQRLLRRRGGPGENLFGESIVCLDAATGEPQVALSDRPPRAVGLRSAGAAEPRPR